MTTKLEQAARQALEALEEWKIDVEFEGDIFYAQPAITALKNALKELEDADKRKSEQSV